ncbi:hypothetical protein SBADM41S_11744 [Streptomyces badius]
MRATYWDASGTAFTERVDRWRYLTALDVLTDEADGTVVAFWGLAHRRQGLHG